MEGLRITDEGLRIENYETEDPEIVGYFDDIDGDVEAEFERVLRAGVVALRSAGASSEVDYVDKRFMQLEQEFEDVVDEFFGENGDVPELLEEQLGDDGRLIEIFDPHEEGTPLSKVRQRMESEFEELRKEIGIAEKEEEMVEQTRLKGEEFEEYLGDLLAEVADVTGDRVEFTGDDHGELEGKKKGDFVIELNELPASIAIEAKNTGVTQPDIENEMDLGMRNRDADYGILIAESRSNLPQKLGVFKEFDDYIVVALSEDGEPKPEIVKLAYRWARIRAFEDRAKASDDFDATEIVESVESIESAVQKFQQIRRQCTNIRGNADDIEEYADEIQEEIEADIAGIERELQKAVEDV